MLFSLYNFPVIFFAAFTRFFFSVFLSTMFTYFKRESCSELNQPSPYPCFLLLSFLIFVSSVTGTWTQLVSYCLMNIFDLLIPVSITPGTSLPPGPNYSSFTFWYIYAFYLPTLMELSSYLPPLSPFPLSWRIFHSHQLPQFGINAVFALSGGFWVVHSPSAFIWNLLPFWRLCCPIITFFFWFYYYQKRTSSHASTFLESFSTWFTISTLLHPLKQFSSITEYFGAQLHKPGSSPRSTPY